jgi:hypothetical protein
MPRLTTAELSSPLAFPDEPGAPLWREERRMPVLVLFAVPLAILLAGVVVVQSPVVRLALVAAAIVVVWLLVRARRGSLIETFAVSDRYVTVVQPRGGRVALPVTSLTHVTIQADRVRLESAEGVVTLGFVRRRKALAATLEAVAPAAAIDWDGPAFCPT